MKTKRRLAAHPRLREVQTGMVASFQQHGPGTIGPNGVSSIVQRNGSRRVLGSTFELQFGKLANSPLAFCSVRIAPGPISALGNLGGVAAWNSRRPQSSAIPGAR
jgi:hypothetical protein